MAAVAGWESLSMSCQQLAFGRAAPKCLSAPHPTGAAWAAAAQQHISALVDKLHWQLLSQYHQQTCCCFRVSETIVGPQRVLLYFEVLPTWEVSY